MEQRHETVLLIEAIEELGVVPGDVVVDATFGAGGHFAKLAEALSGRGTLIGIDADENSFVRAQELIQKVRDSGVTVHLVNDNFRNLARILDTLGIEKADRILFDLGWNSFQLSEGRGFSFRVDEPLLMTYGDPETHTTARDLVNSLKEQELADLMYTYGEERFSRSIARAIVETRKKAKIETTEDLVNIINEATPAWYHHRKIHPATKTFQALRIATNDELGALRDALSASMSRLSHGGRIAVISFHSIEDRIVKSTFKDGAHSGTGSVRTKKPIVPGSNELVGNPRARSAKLRVFECCGRQSASALSLHPVQEYA